MITPGMQYLDRVVRFYRTAPGTIKGFFIPSTTSGVRQPCAVGVR